MKHDTYAALKKPVSFKDSCNTTARLLSSEQKGGLPMVRSFTVGDKVEWRYIGGKRWAGGRIGSIDRNSGFMVVYQGHLYNMEASRVQHTIQRVNGRWIAFRVGTNYYRDRIRRVKT